MIAREEITASLALELRRGNIVLCVLSQLKKPMYGYSLVDVLTDGGMPVETNTLYPLLRRLEKQGLLESFWETSGAKPRKYYKITELGESVYLDLKGQWEESTKIMRKLLEY